MAVTADGSSQTVHSFLAIAEELDARSHASLRRKTRLHIASVSKGVHNSAGSSYKDDERSGLKPGINVTKYVYDR